MSGNVLVYTWHCFSPWLVFLRHFTGKSLLCSIFLCGCVVSLPAVGAVYWLPIDEAMDTIVKMLERGEIVYERTTTKIDIHPVRRFVL